MRPAIAKQKKPILPTLTVGGFTLVELMIAIFILSIIMAVSYTHLRAHETS